LWSAALYRRFGFWLWNAALYRRFGFFLACPGGREGGKKTKNKSGGKAPQSKCKQEKWIP
jgi:hypothetical protein